MNNIDFPTTCDLWSWYHDHKYIVKSWYSSIHDASWVQWNTGSFPDVLQLSHQEQNQRKGKEIQKLAVHLVHLKWGLNTEWREVFLEQQCRMLCFLDAKRWRWRRRKPRGVCWRTRNQRRRRPRKRRRVGGGPSRLLAPRKTNTKATENPEVWDCSPLMKIPSLQSEGLCTCLVQCRCFTVELKAQSTV